MGGVRTGVIVEGTTNVAFCPVMGTTPAATSWGGLHPYGAPGTVREGPDGPHALQVPSPRASGYSLEATGDFTPDVYFVPISPGLYPQTIHGVNDSAIPEPAGYYDRLPPSIANPPKLGTFRSMFQPKALLAWLKLDGSPAA